MNRAPFAGVIFFLCALVLVFGAFSVGRKINVDENVFVASAALVSHQHLALYRDFHYNHMPTLVLIYAWLFHQTGYFLLAARSFSAVSAAGAATVVFAVTYHVFEPFGRKRRLWIAIGIGVFFLANPLFTRAAGRAWNHDFPVFTSLVGFLAMSRGLRGSAQNSGHFRGKDDRQDAKTPRKSARRKLFNSLLCVFLGVLASWRSYSSAVSESDPRGKVGCCVLRRPQCTLLLLAGFLVGLAVTTRLTFATELLPFVLFVLIHPNLRRPARLTLLALFAAGFLIAAAPTIWVWAQSPANAYFGNFQYPAFNTQWHSLNDNSEHHRYTLVSKIWFYLFNTCLEYPGNGIVLVGFLIALKSNLRWREIRRDPWQCQLAILALLAASQIAAGLVPSPPFFQYFYAATPFMFLALVICMAKIPNLGGDRGLNWIFAGCMALSLGFAIPEYRGFPRLFSFESWWPVKAHNIGLEVAGLAGKGPVLTLDPIYALEGGSEIYPGVSTGPFGMRVGDYLTPSQREKFGMWGTDDIAALFANHPPPAVLISPGSDDQIEALFTREAQAYGYREVNVNDKNPAIQLWLPTALAAAERY